MSLLDENIDNDKSVNYNGYSKMTDNLTNKKKNEE